MTTGGNRWRRYESSIIRSAYSHLPPWPSGYPDKAIGVNPGEAAIRSMRSAEPGGRGLLGWEFAGVASAVGAAVARFKVGDRVFGTEDMTRDGCWAETLLAVRWCLDLG